MHTCVGPQRTSPVACHLPRRCAQSETSVSTELQCTGNPWVGRWRDPRSETTSFVPCFNTPSVPGEEEKVGIEAVGVPRDTHRNSKILILPVSLRFLESKVPLERGTRETVLHLLCKIL